MEETEEHAVDQIFSRLGLGRWQIGQYFWLILLLPPWAVQSMSILMLGFIPEFSCVPTVHQNDSNITEITFDQQCSFQNYSINTTVQCDGSEGIIIYREPKDVSIVSELDLTCGLEYLSEVSQTVLVVGQMVGAAIFSPLADAYGRKRIMVWTHLALIITAVATSFLPDITSFIASRAILGIFLGGCTAAQWVHVLEIFIPKHRTPAALLANVIWGLSTCFIPLIGYIMKGYSWRYTQLLYTATSFCIVGQILWTDESLRWILANDRMDEAKNIVRKACKTNKVPSEKEESIMTNFFSFNDPDSNSSVMLHPLENGHAIGSAESLTGVGVSYMDMIKHPYLMRINLILILAWFCNSLIYGGLYMLSSVMPGDRYLNLFLNTVVEVPASIASIPLIMKFGRRSVCVFFHLLAGVSMISAIAIFFTRGRVADAVEIIVIVVGKFSITSSYNLLYMYSPELYPTNVRSLGLGVATVACRIGGLIYPYTATLARYIRWLPTTIFGGLCIVVAIACWFLPETANKDLPQTLEHLEELFTDTKKSKRKL